VRLTATVSAARTGPNPYAYLPKVPSFRLTSTTVRNGHPLPTAQLSKLFKVPGGEDISPELSWHGFPTATKSFIVSMYDPEAPTGGGFWHWVLVDLPASTKSLKADAGRLGGTLPGSAFDLLGDAGVRQYVGGAPPAGSGVHDYYLTVTALNVAALPGIRRSSSADYTGFVASGHTIARATIVAPTEIPK
jgi:Raf kinase inhibitor-like YbhB/YbcL family protein